MLCGCARSQKQRQTTSHRTKNNVSGTIAKHEAHSRYSDQNFPFLGVWDGHVHTAVFKTDNQQGPAV